MDVPSVIENSEGGMGISLLTWNNRNDIYIPGRNNKKNQTNVQNTGV